MSRPPSVGERAWPAFPALMVAVALLGAAHLLVRTSLQGVILSHDSLMYLSVADSLTAGEGLRDYTGDPWTVAPPLLPILLAVGGISGIEPVDACRFLNVLAFVLIVLAAWKWLDSNLQSRSLAAFATVFIAFSFPLGQIASWAMADMFFTLFTLLALIQLEAHLRRDRDRKPFVLSAVFAALASVTRYVGIFAVGAAALAILVRRDRPLFRKFGATVAYAVIALVPLATVLTRNWIVSSVPVEEEWVWANYSWIDEGLALAAGRFPAAGATYSWIDALLQALTVVGGFLLPMPKEYAADFGFVPWVLIGIVAAMALGTLGWPGSGGHVPTSKGSSALEPLRPFGIYALAHIGGICALAPIATGQPVDLRYLAPAYVPLVFSAAFVADRFLGTGNEIGRIRFKIALASVATISALANMGANVYMTEMLLRNARKDRTPDSARTDSDTMRNVMNAAYWEGSETLEYARSNPMSRPLYSNAAGLLHGLANLPPPLRRIPRMASAEDCLAWLQTTRRTPETYFVWFDRPMNDAGICELPALEQQAGLIAVARLSDGAVYRLDRE